MMVKNDNMMAGSRQLRASTARLESFFQRTIKSQNFLRAVLIRLFYTLRETMRWQGIVLGMPRAVLVKLVSTQLLAKDREAPPSARLDEEDVKFG